MFFSPEYNVLLKKFNRKKNFFFDWNKIIIDAWNCKKYQNFFYKSEYNWYNLFIVFYIHLFAKIKCLQSLFFVSVPFSNSFLHIFLLLLLVNSMRNYFKMFEIEIVGRLGCDYEFCTLFNLKKISLDYIKFNWIFNR